MDEDGEEILRDVPNQNYIHNQKKIDNHLDYVTRDLRIGLRSVHRNCLGLVSQEFSQHVHGLRDEDINKRDRMNWASAQRRRFPQVRDCLKMIKDGNCQIHNPSVAATIAFLTITYLYVEILVSLKATLYERVKNAATVVTFLDIWQNFIILEPDLNLKNNFLTRETIQDVILSCHAAVTVIAWFS